jgi:hypothetical protein
METTSKETNTKRTKPSIRNTKSLIFLSGKTNASEKYIRRKTYEISLEKLMNLEIRLKN